MNLTDNEITLKPWNMADAILLTEAITESLPDLRRYISWMSPNWSIETSNDYIERTIQANQKNWRAFAIYHGNRFIGSISLILKDNRGTVGYWVRSSERRKGYCLKALNLLILYAFDTMGTEYLKFVIDVDNIISIDLVKKIGASLFKIMSDRLESDEGKHDAAIYRLYRDKYEK
jgi:ribosomal-protein-serine acetyltransferase